MSIERKLKDEEELMRLFLEEELGGIEMFTLVVLDLWIFVVGLVGCYLLLAPVIGERVQPAYSVSVVQVQFKDLIVSYGRKKSYDNFSGY